MAGAMKGNPNLAPDGQSWRMWPCGCRAEPPSRKPGVNTSLTPEMAAAWRAEMAAVRKGERESKRRPNKYNRVGKEPLRHKQITGLECNRICRFARAPQPIG